LACSALTESNTISLRVYQRSKADFKIKGHSRGGTSMLLDPEGGKGIIHIFFDRVTEVSASHKVPLELVLGITIAHEIGHLLLHHEVHTLAGIMRAQLDSSDWRLAAQGALGFSTEQRQVIAARVEPACTFSLALSNSLLTIRIRNVAEVSPGTLNRAVKEADGIFGQAGIHAKWLECASTETVSECQGLPGPMKIDLRIVLRNPRRQGADNLFGLATPYEDFGINAAVFYEHAQNFARGGAASVAQILGHAMAHEIGHLLLSSNSHSSSGIMKASWSREDLREIAMGHLAFTFQQAEVMRGNVKARARPQDYMKGLGEATSPRMGQKTWWVGQ
jgi:hypothetical protein